MQAIRPLIKDRIRLPKPHKETVGVSRRYPPKRLVLSRDHALLKHTIGQGRDIVEASDILVLLSHRLGFSDVRVFILSGKISRPNGEDAAPYTVLQWCFLVIVVVVARETPGEAMVDVPVLVYHVFNGIFAIGRAEVTRDRVHPVVVIGAVGIVVVN